MDADDFLAAADAAEKSGGDEPDADADAGAHAAWIEVREKCKKKGIALRAKAGKTIRASGK